MWTKSIIYMKRLGNVKNNSQKSYWLKEMRVVFSPWPVDKKVLRRIAVNICKFQSFDIFWKGEVSVLNTQKCTYYVRLLLFRPRECAQNENPIEFHIKFFVERYSSVCCLPIKLFYSTDRPQQLISCACVHFCPFRFDSIDVCP